MSQIPIDASLPGLALALAIGLMLGVERGWQLRDEKAGRRVAGIRTFAILGLIGGLAGIAAAGPAAPLAILIVTGAVGALLLGYVLAVSREDKVSATSTLAGILTIGLGALAATGNMALASVGAGAATILLASRAPLHRAIRSTSETDIKALLRLVLVVFVILPLLPNISTGPFHALNPFRLWTVVVITGSISFLGYILVRWFGEQRGALVTAAVGSLVSSTAVTVHGASRVREGASGPSAHATVAIGSTVMLLRSLFLVGVIAPAAFTPFAALVAPGLLVSTIGAAILLWFGRSTPGTMDTAGLKPPGLKLAFFFAISVAALSIASAWAQANWGGVSGAIFIALGGAGDIDAAIAAVGALPPDILPVHMAALALAAPTLLNTLFKLGLFVMIAGWRRALLGSVALGAAAIALLIPLTIALT